MGVLDLGGFGWLGLGLGLGWFGLVLVGFVCFGVVCGGSCCVWGEGIGGDLGGIWVGLVGFGFVLVGLAGFWWVLGRLVGTHHCAKNTRSSVNKA